MGLFSTIKDIGSKALDYGKDLFSSKSPYSNLVNSAVSFGGRLLENQFIGSPNAKTAYENEVLSSREAFDRSQQAYAQRYQTTARDFKAAGLNPILAAGGGFSVSGQPQMKPASSPQAHQPTFDPLNSAKTVAETELTSQKTSESKSNVQKNLNDAKLSLQKIVESKAKSGQLTQQERNLAQEMFNLEHQATLILRQQTKVEQETAKLARETELTSTQSSYIKAQKDYLVKQAKNLQVKTQRLKSYLKKEQKVGKVYGSIIGNLFIAIEMAIRSIIPLSINLGK